MYKRYLHKYFLNFTIPIDQAMISAASRCLCQTLVTRSSIIDQASVPDLN
jgi:hypothetical protein